MHGAVTHGCSPANATRAGYLKRLAARLLGGSALVAAALTVPSGPAHAQCVTTGTTVNCTGNGDVSNGVIDGVDFNTPPIGNVETIRVFNIDANIAPAAGDAGVFSQTVNANDPLTIFIDIAPFQIITENANGISALTSGNFSPITIDNFAAVSTQGAVGGFGITALTIGNNSGIMLDNWGAISTLSAEDTGIFAQTFLSDCDIMLDNGGAISTVNADGISAAAGGPNSPITLDNWGAISTQGDDARGIFVQSSDLNNR